MSNKDEALKLALEALESMSGTILELGEQTTFNEDQAITAIKEALAQSAQEPVAYCYVQKCTSVDILTFDPEPDDAVAGTLFPLYTTPPQPAQQPQVRTGNCLLCGVCASEGHKIQAKRPWVGLTEDEIKKVIAEVSQIPPIDFTSTTYGRAIEAKLKDKNGG